MMSRITRFRLAGLVLLTCAAAHGVGCHDDHHDDGYQYQQRYEEPDDRVHVRAPFVDVRVGRDDRVRVLAPGADVDTDRDAGYAGPLPMTIVVDHVVIGCPDLDRMMQSFASAGLPGNDGGMHADGATRMGIISFPDGSYIELISPAGGRTKPMFSEKRLRADVPCAWAIRSNDLDADAARFEGRGVRVRGPFSGGRQRPDGVDLRWRIAEVGPGDLGETLPFLIQDETSRWLRTNAPASSSIRDAWGVAIVVIAYDDLDDGIAEFRTAFDWPPPIMQDDSALGARLAYFPGTPVVLAEPLSHHDWLDEYVDTFGDGPVAYLIGTPQLDTASAHFPVRDQSVWFGRRMAWIDVPSLGKRHLGLIE